MNNINHQDRESINSNMKRRHFIEYCAVLGLASTLLPGCKGKTVGEKGESVTVNAIEAAEKIIGIELTPEERKKITGELNKNLDIYDDIREEHMDNSVQCSLVFNPIPPGMTFQTERKPPVFSDTHSERPGRLEDVAFNSVLQLAHLIKTGQVTSLELTEMYLARLKKYDSKLKFVITLTEELALKQAKRADSEMRAGKYRGSLHGIPYGIKDLFSVKGYRTTWGAQPYKNRIINRNATVIERLEEAGAVLVAKLTTGALATGDVWFGGKTRNPWNPEKGSSGSSAGPASATAAGCVAFAVGTESNGSIISPCYECGVTGLRPTFGRVSRYGAMTASWSMDKVGPICRTVEDCAVVLDAIYGPDGKDNTTIDLPFNWNPNPDISQLRIGVFEKYFKRELLGNPEKEEWKAFRKKEQILGNQVLNVLSKLGATLRPLDFDIPTLGTGFILTTEAAAAFDDFTLGSDDDAMEESRAPDIFRHRRFVPAVEYIQANRYRMRLIEKMNEVMKDLDVFVEIADTNTLLTNLTGHPVVIVPCGFIDGIPAGIIFVGKLFGEAETLAVAKAFQDATDFHLKHPEL